METTQFFRCYVCAKATEMTEQLKKGDPKCRCGSSRFFPAVLTRFEVFKYLLTHPKTLLDTIVFKLRGKYDR